jgi:hypothetical protein
LAECMTEEDNNEQNGVAPANIPSVVGDLDKDDLRWLEESTAASGVPLHVDDVEAIDDLASLLTLSERS